MSAQDATDATEKLTTAAKAAVSSAEEYKDAVDGLSDIADEYKKVYREVDNVAEREEQLKSIQDDLISQYSHQAEGIDLVNGEYDQQIEKLDALISKNKELEEAKRGAAIRDLQSAQNEMTYVGNAALINFLGYEGGVRGAMIEAAYDYAKKNLNTFDITDTYFGGFNFGGAFEERAADLEKFYNYLVNVADPTGSYLSDLQNDVLEQWEAAVENAELLKSLTADTSQTLNPINPSTTHNSAEYYEELGKTALAESEARLAALQDIYEKSEEEFQKKRDDLDYQYSMGLISAEEYYSQLSNMKSQYLQPDSDEWRSVSVELKKYYDSLTAEQQKAIDEAAKARTAAYNEEKSQLQFRLKTNQITEKQYYTELAKIRDKYLDKKSSEWRSAYHEAYQYNQQLLQTNKDALTQLLSDASDTTLSALENITAARDSLASKLMDFNKTFEKVTETVPETIAVKGNFTITTAEHEVETYRMGADSIEDNIKVLEEYGAMLDALKARGADESTLNDILAMDVDEAMEFGGKLLKMSDKEWNAYFDSMAKLRQTATDISAKYYQNEVERLRDNFIDKLRSELDGLGADMYNVGADVAAEFVSGWNEALGTQNLTIGELMRAVAGGTLDTAPKAAQQLVASGNARADTEKTTVQGQNIITVPVYIGTKKIAEIMMDATNGEIIRTGKNVLLT